MEVNQNSLPKEWADLAKYLMESNISKEKFKLFLKQEKEKRKKSDPDISRKRS
jgi:hypothetical protein